jgi:GAG-pre-integrase domain
VILFKIPKVIFQEKRTDRLLRTDTWYNGLWYMNRKGTDSALSSIVGRIGGVERSVNDSLLLRHKRLSHPSFSILSRLYPSLFKKTNKEKLVCDACELGKHTKSFYVSSCNESSCLLNLIHSNVSLIVFLVWLDFT